MNKLQLLQAIDKRAMKAAELYDDNDTEGRRIAYESRLNVEFRNLDRVMKLMPRLDALLEKNNISTKLEKLDENLFWITLRPSDDHKDRFEEFKNYCEKYYLTRQMFVSYTYVWEQKGEIMNDVGKGYHIHILATLTKTTQKHHLIRNTKSTFNKFLMGECPDAFVEIRKVDTLIYKSNLLHYISGVKLVKASDEIDKSKAVAIDIEFRKKYKLEAFYSNDAPIQDQLRGIILDNNI